jgi:acyl-CoA synthetase (AMP-forming)/AMP-acid ligase II
MPRSRPGSELSLLAWLDDPSPRHGIRFCRSEGWDLWTYERLAELVRRTAGGLARAGVRQGGVVALLLPAGPEFVGGFFGALLAGAVPTPIAPPRRFEEPGDYRRQVLGILREAAPEVLVTVAELAGETGRLAGAAGVDRALTFEQVTRSAPAAVRPQARGRGELGLLQFTSGTTGRPRGVRVTLDALAANVGAIRRWLRMTPEDASASWLPVHHDMGLVGCLLTPVVNGSDLWLMRPEDFVRRPLRYLRCFGAAGARLTAMPGFGLEHLARRVHREDLDGLDFREWRAVVVGAERLQARALRCFCELLAPRGFRPAALLPAYGLAEATVAVTGLPLDEEWRAVTVRPERLARGAVAEPAPSGVQVVGCGSPLEGVRVSIQDEAGRPLPDGHVGEIVVGGASLAAGHAGDGSSSITRFRDGELLSGDAGFWLDGQLFVLGRLGDSIKIRGLHLFAEDLESALLDAGVPSRHLAVVLGVRDGVPTALALLDRPVEAWRRQAEALLRRRVEGGEVVVANVPSGAIARTSSGKPRRRALWQEFCRGRLGRTPASGREVIQC